MKVSPIKAMVFDLGEVLIKLDFSEVMKLRHSNEKGLNASIQSMNRWPIYDAFERGHLSEIDFLNQINKELSTTLSLESFRPLWNSVLKESVPGIEGILNTLAKHYPLWVLTNSNETHIHYFKSRYSWYRLFQSILTSFELGCRKPEKEIYQKLIAKTGFESHELLFLDDREENVEGARAVGIQAELCKNTPADLPDILRRHSIRY